MINVKLLEHTWKVLVDQKVHSGFFHSYGANPQKVIYMCVYVCVYMYVCIYVYVYFSSL